MRRRRSSRTLNTSGLPHLNFRRCHNSGLCAAMTTIHARAAPMEPRANALPFVLGARPHRPPMQMVKARHTEESCNWVPAVAFRMQPQPRVGITRKRSMRTDENSNPSPDTRTAGHRELEYISARAPTAASITPRSRGLFSCRVSARSRRESRPGSRSAGTALRETALVAPTATRTIDVPKNIP